MVLKCKTTWRDGNTHLVMAPLEFMQRHVGCRPWGSQIRECYVGCGSCADFDQWPLWGGLIVTAMTSSYLEI